MDKVTWIIHQKLKPLRSQIKSYYPSGAIIQRIILLDLLCENGQFLVKTRELALHQQEIKS